MHPRTGDSKFWLRKQRGERLARELRLGYEPPRAAAGSTVAVVRGIVRRRQDHRGRVRPSGQTGGDRQAAHVGQLDVEQDDRGPVVAGGLEGGSTVLCLGDDGEAACLEPAPGAGAKARVVVDDEY